MSTLDESAAHLQEAPFGTKPRGYFITSELNQRLNLIRHLIQNSEPLLLVLAELGCGKTALLNQLRKIASKQHEHWWLYTLNSSPALSPEVLISTLLSAFNIRQEGKPTQVLQESLRNHLASTRYAGKLPILLVDDAHRLPLATLKLIIDLAMQGESLSKMRVVLFCEPQITSILATPEFEIVHHTLIHTLDIPPFSKTQTRDYLQFCLEGSKYNTLHLFTHDLLKKIYLESEGIPAEINLCAQEVLHKFSQQRNRSLLPSSLSYYKLVWGIPIIIFMMIGIALLYWYYPNLVNQEAPPQPELPIKLPLATGFETLPPAILSPPSDSPPPTTTPLPPPMATPPVPSKGVEWLRQQSPETYTLQILGAYEEDTLQKFLTQYPFLNQKANVFKTSFNNKEWYVLMYGTFSTRPEALAALETFPTPLRQNTHPWIRTLGSIQKLLKEEK